MNTGVSDSSEPEPARPGVAASIWALEHAQDFVSVAVGVVLIVLAATLAVSGVVSFAEDVQRHSVATAAINLLDRVLLVLILVEIVHTVVLSLRAHRLAAQPFIVVGLVAVIRRILYLAVSYFEKPDPEDSSAPARAPGKKNSPDTVEPSGG
jgi:uncharacterized membrane protein (DUF373 family)